MFTVKQASKRDLEEVETIEKVSHARPWNIKAFECELSKSSSGASLFICAVTEDTGEVAGYLTGDWIVDYLHISNIAVRPDFRGKGAGKKLLERAFQETIKRKFRSVTLEVRENNEEAVGLYKKAGFEIKGRRPGFYEGKYDGLLMWKTLL